MTEINIEEIELELESDEDTLGCRIEPDSSDEDEASNDKDYLKLGITKEESEKNYKLIGELINMDPSTINLDELQIKHPTAFSYESKTALMSVLKDLKLPFQLSDFQAMLFKFICLLFLLFTRRFHT